MTLHFLHRAVVVPKAPVPVLIPADMDDLLSQRAYAHNLTMHLLASSHPYELVRREGDFWDRLDAIARRRAQA